MSAPGGSCVVCGTPFVAPLYDSAAPQSLTSLCTVVDQSTVVFQCSTCSHVQTPPIDDLDGYYGSTYRILIESEEEDQLYSIVDGQPVFRAAHQATTFLRKVSLPPRAQVLDYGAAKGATMRAVREQRPDVAPHFFDVSDMYVDFWRSLVPDERWATHVLPAGWQGAFDAVASFFMLEHVAAPIEVLRAMAGCLRPGGTLYGIVPNPLTNIADFVVVDHVNHFTAASLCRAIEHAGLVDIDIEDASHDGAWTFRARRGSNALEQGQPSGVTSDVVASSQDAAQAVAQYWRDVTGRVRSAERAIAGQPAAIYGAGFYGSYLRSQLDDPDRVVAYIDQNPFLQGTEHLDRPVLPPDALPDRVRDIYVGLNPRGARSAIESIEVWHGRNLRFHYL